MPLSLLALAAGAFGFGTTEFIIMGLLRQVGAYLGISIGIATCRREINRTLLSAHNGTPVVPHWHRSPCPPVSRWAPTA